MLEIIKKKKQKAHAGNVIPILGSITNPNLPEEGVDVVLMVDAYHEFSNPKEMMENIVRALRPGGHLFLIEYRGEDASVAKSPLHKMTTKQARKEMKAVGLNWLRTENFLPEQHFMIFEKP
jgi:ubiquinone/menaquinone biosynthesis C-methylase UbiE